MRPSMSVVLLAFVGFRSTPFYPPAECSSPLATAASVDSATLARLTPGQFVLISVNTSRGYGGSIQRGSLTLVRLHEENELVDRQTFAGPRKFWRPFAGRFEMIAGGRTYRDTAEVSAQGLAIGCVDCMDASPTSYTIVAVSPEGFVGRWANNQTGIGVAVDRRGRRLPNPGGFYCARRVES
jgi:hypothetical protein